MHQVPSTADCLEAALQYAARGWPVFAVSRSKIPFKGSHGHLDATTDAAAIERMWATHSGANVALATGALAVFDCDGAEGRQAFVALGKSPRTLVARTPRGGLHFYYAASDAQLRGWNAPRKAKGDGGLDIKAHGGFVLLPPSRDRLGGAYSWANQDPIATIPAHLLAFAQSIGGRREAIGPALQLPAHLAGRAARNLIEAGLSGLGLEWTAHEDARVCAALNSIGRNCGYDVFFKMCCALHQLNWQRSDGTDRGFEILCQWCEQFSDVFNLEGLEYKWKSLRADYRYARATVGTLFYLAGEAGWDGTVKVESEVMPFDRRIQSAILKSETKPPVPMTTEPGAFVASPSASGALQQHADVISYEGDAPVPAPLTASPQGNEPSASASRRGEPSPEATEAAGDMNGHVIALPPALTLVFPDTDKSGRPRPTCANTAAAIGGLGIDCRQDVFHERLLVGGHPIAQWAGDLSDGAVLMLRKVIWRAFAFDPGERHARDAAMQLCLEHQFNPVTDYLDALRWDGVSRIATWTLRYLGAADNELHREFGRLMLIAAVRRARAPGCKFDQIVVLEGPQGIGKSSAIRILAGEDNFSDQHILGASDREQQEAFRGVWLHEIAELAGMRRTDVERVKQFARRTEDRARPAYGRMRQDMKRRGIFVATTNEEEYLKEYDRAFWPIACGRVDLGGLREARDQLWAEAALCEARGDSIELPERLRAQASEQQAERHEQDPWEPLVAATIKTDAETSVDTILRGGVFHFVANEITQTAQNRVARILKKWGFRRFRQRDGVKRHYIYKKCGDVGTV